MQTHPAFMVASAERGTMGIHTYVSVQLTTLDITARRKWINVPHSNAPMVIHANLYIKTNPSPSLDLEIIQNTVIAHRTVFFFA